MRRCWIGLGLLIVLLGLGIFSTVSMVSTHTAVAEQLEQAANEALSENWAGAETAITAARKKWEEKWHLSAALSDHEPMEEIDSLFAQLEVYQASRDPIPLAALCAQLSRMVEAMGEAHACNWWNIL